ncbi:MAG: hypothetical protein WC532_07415 [Candidatus Omnitrophota bacterium]
MKFIIAILSLILFFTCAWAQEATVTTDKLEYSQGESVKITLKNNSTQSIFSHIGGTSSGFGIRYAEKKTSSGNWEKLFTYCQYPHCIRDIGPPEEMKSGESNTYEWDPLIYIDGTEKSIKADPGTYRLVVSYQIRNSASSEDWKWLTVNSNEFIIK